MEWETTGRGAGLGATRGFVVAVLGVRGLADIRVEVSSSRWVLCFRVERTQVRENVGCDFFAITPCPALPVSRGGAGRPGPSLPRPSPQVDYVEPSQNTISLKMIPRIDYDRIKARMSLVPGDALGLTGGEGAPDPCRWPSPPPSPFPPTPPCLHRKTGLPKGRSLSGLLRGCSTLRRSGECHWGLAGQVL